MKHTCPVCGWPHLAEEPRPAGGGGSFEICPCCGFEFGVSDDDRGISFEQWRARWIAGGMHWWSKAHPAPAHWDAARQLAHAGLR